MKKNANSVSRMKKSSPIVSVKVFQSKRGYGSVKTITKKFFNSELGRVCYGGVKISADGSRRAF